MPAESKNMEGNQDTTKTADSLYERLVSVTFTRADVLRRIRIVREFCEYRYFSGHRSDDFSAFAQAKGIGEYDMQALISLGEAFFSPFTRENAYTMLDAMMARAKSATGINIYLPFTPVDSDILKLGEWFRRSVGPTSLLDIRLDEGLVGGCALVRRDRYMDYTIRYFMDKHRSDISGIIDRYADA